MNLKLMHYNSGFQIIKKILAIKRRNNKINIFGVSFEVSLYCIFFKLYVSSLGCIPTLVCLLGRTINKVCKVSRKAREGILLPFIDFQLNCTNMGIYSVVVSLLVKRNKR